MIEETVSKSQVAITRTPGVCGGRACIAGTGIAVWLLQSYWQEGTMDAELLNAYPHLTQHQLFEARRYVGDHATEIARDIADQLDDGERA